MTGRGMAISRVSGRRTRAVRVVGIRARIGSKGRRTKARTVVTGVVRWGGTGCDGESAVEARCKTEVCVEVEERADSTTLPGVPCMPTPPVEEARGDEGRTGTVPDSLTDLPVFEKSRLRAPNI